MNWHKSQTGWLRSWGARAFCPPCPAYCRTAKNRPPQSTPVQPAAAAGNMPAAASKMLARNAGRQLKSDREVRAIFADLAEAIENTSRLAERLIFSLENIGYKFPEYPVPVGHCMDSFLRTIVWFGAQQRYAAISPKVKRQIEEELALITKLGFPGYFLIVWDIVNFCREHNIMVQGRGSAANSAVCC